MTVIKCVVGTLSRDRLILPKLLDCIGAMAQQTRMYQIHHSSKFSDPRRTGVCAYAVPH